MKILFVNLPYPERLTRRYMCSYVSSTSLFPPYELMSAAGSVRQSSKHEIDLIDCIAESKTIIDLCQLIEKIKPKIVLSLIGIDSFDYDIKSVNYIKRKFPDIVQVVFGHYPSIFSEEILSKSTIDIIIKGEPDIVINALASNIQNNENLNNIPGISYRGNEEEVFHNPPTKRISDLDSLGIPAHDLINSKNYFEPFMPEPFGMIQTSRGCPYSCNYCITSYGKRFATKSIDNIINELNLLVKVHKIRSFRIIDDTFTIQKEWVINFCKKLIEENLDLQWGCLSRTDTLNEEMLLWMKKSGCIRIHFGLESASQSTLDFYEKGVKVKEAKDMLLLCDKIGIETAGLLMAGLPNETIEDINKTLQFAKESKLTYIGCGELTPYPGTPLFDTLRSQIHFSLFPYSLKFNDITVTENAHKYIKYIHKKFYTRRSKIIFFLIKIIKQPILSFQTFRKRLSNNKSKNNNLKKMSIP